MRQQAINIRNPLVTTNRRTGRFFYVSNLLLALLIGLPAVSANAEEAPLSDSHSQSHALNDSSPTDARTWMLAMSKAMQALNYEGVVAYEYGSELVNILVRHAVIDGQVYEYLSHLNNTPREIVRRGVDIRCYHQGKSELRLGVEPLDFKAIIDPEALSQSYALSLMGVQRVADRNTIVAELRAKDGYRYGRRLFIDEASKLLLKMVVFDAKRRPLERFQFMRIEIDPPMSQDDFKVSLAAQDDNKRQASEASTALSSATLKKWHVAWLPEGFQVLSGGGSEVQAYTDGLATFSVFVELVANGAHNAAKMQRGASLVYSRPMMADKQVFNVTVVGEITQQAAERIAASIRW